MSRSGTPMQRLRDKQRARPAPELVSYLQGRGLEIAVEDAQEAADLAAVDATEALADAAAAQTDADAAQLKIDQTLDGTQAFEALNVDGVNVAPFLGHTDGTVLDDPVAVPQSVIEAQVRAAVGATAPVTFDSGTGAFGWAGGKSDVGLANVDNTSDANKPVSTAQQAALDLKLSLTQVGAAGGVATLDGASKIPTSQLPALAVTDVFVVNSQAAQLALTAEEGDVAVRTDLNKSYIHNGGTAGTMADWQELLTPTDAVLSVNGLTGAVTLTTANVAEGGGVLYFTNARADGRIALAVGDSVQAYDANLTTWAGKTAPSGAVVGTTDSQTLTNKTLTSPVVNSPTGIVKADVGLGNVPNESKATMFTNPAFTGAIGLNCTPPGGVLFRLEDNGFDDVGIDFVRTSATDMVLLAYDRTAGAWCNWVLAGTRIALRYEATEHLIVDAGGLKAILPTYADNAAAVAGGLTVTSLYKTATGEVRIVV